METVRFMAKKVLKNLNALGSRLRELKKKIPSLKGKSNKMIDKFQNYYGIALRSDLQSVATMKKISHDSH